MAYLGIALLLVFPYLVEFLQKRIDRSYTERIEKKHQDFADTLQGNPLVVRELKARAETMIHYGMKEYQDIDYDPQSVREVTTPEERAARRKAELSGRKYVHKWTEDQIEEVIEYLLEKTGGTREELAAAFPNVAEKMAQSYSKECCVDIEDARFVVVQIMAALCGDEVPVKGKGKVKKSDIVPGEKLYELNGIPMRSIRSTSVRAAGYDERNMILYLEFTSGAKYRYLDVPNFEYINLINTGSPGRFVKNVLTLEYKYEPVY